MIRKQGILRILSALLLILLSFSCASDLDYEQVNTIKLEPVVVSNLAYFDVPANQFVTDGIEQSPIFDVSTINIFNEAFFTNKLRRVDLFFEVNNTIKRGYSIDLFFLDNANQPLHNTSFTIPAYSGTTNIVTRTEIFENTQLDLLKRTKKIAFALQMMSGPPLTENSLGSLKLRSSVTAYFVVE